MKKFYLRKLCVTILALLCAATLTPTFTGRVQASIPPPSTSVTLSTPSKDATITRAISYYVPTSSSPPPPGPEDQNYGADSYLEISSFHSMSSDSSARTLVQFDLPPELSGATIISATLSLYYYNDLGPMAPEGNSIQVCRVTHDWVEGTGTSGTPTQDGVTWNEYNYFDGSDTSTNNWLTGGGDYTLTDGSAAVFPSAPPPAVWISWTVTSIVQGWASGAYPNYGFLLLLEDEGFISCGGVFGSKESTLYPSPKLEITYSPATIESCDSGGVTKDEFLPGEDVYAKGSGFVDNTYDIYVVEDTTWTDGMAIPERVPETAEAVTCVSGAFWELVWAAPLIPGKYDIVVDVGGNGVYDAGVDPLDDMDVGLAGFFVVPEYPLGTILGVAICFAALAVFKSKSLRIHL